MLQWAHRRARWPMPCIDAYASLLLELHGAQLAQGSSEPKRAPRPKTREWMHIRSSCATHTANVINAASKMQHWTTPWQIFAFWSWFIMTNLRRGHEIAWRCFAPQSVPTQRPKDAIQTSCHDRQHFTNAIKRHQFTLMRKMERSIPHPP